MDRALVLLVALALGLGLAADPAAAASQFPYETGETVAINGVVTDPSGRRLADVDVVFEASRLGISLWPPSQVKRDVVRGTTRTGPRGEFALEMTWSWRYNHFEILVGVPVRGPQGDRLHILATMDVTRHMRQGSPVAVPVTVQDIGFLDRLREFLDSLESADERRTYQDAGKPDRVDRVQLPNRLEVSWWYFQQGRVYRFQDGRLARVEEFDPVKPL